MAFGVSIMVVSGGLGLLWIRSQSLDPKYVKAKVNMYKDLADEYKDEAKTWKGKFNQTKQSPTFEGDPDDLTSIIPNIIGSFSDFLPKKLQPFMQNKEIQQALIKKVLDNPEKFTNIIGNLIKRKSSKNTEDQGPATEAQSV